MKEIWRRLRSEEDGQGMVEYALIIGLVAIVLIGVIGQMTGGLSAVFDRIRTALSGS